MTIWGCSTNEWSINEHLLSNYNKRKIIVKIIRNKIIEYKGNKNSYVPKRKLKLRYLSRQENSQRGDPLNKQEFCILVIFK